MHVLMIGTGGASGWPLADCRCASCMLARTAGLHRGPGRVRIDGQLEVTAGHRIDPGPGSRTATHRVVALPGGWDITAPDDGRLLLAAAPGQLPEPPHGTRPFDIALLDLLAEPTELGRLRASGLVHQQTAVAALYTDHRVTSVREMTRRCDIWDAFAASDDQLITGPVPLRKPKPRPHRTLIVGGARSGKSAEAELRLAGEPSVTYLAAGPWPSLTAADRRQDSEWAARVAFHQARRPAWWRTVETLDVAGVLRRETGAVLIDGIGTWLAGVMDEAGLWEAEPLSAIPPERQEQPGAEAAAVVQARIGELVDAWRQTTALVVAVTDQVGSGLVPPYWAGRVFRDQLGWLNQRIAAESELNLQVVAGRVVTLPA